MATKDKIKFSLLALLVTAVLTNTAISCIIVLQQRDDRAALENLETDVQQMKEALEVEIELREEIFPKLQNSVQLLRRYNPRLDHMTALSYAWKIYQCSDETVGFEILNALIVVESGANHRAESIQGALGLTQVMPDIWSHDYETLINPYQNIEIGAEILRSYVERHGLQGGLSAYNCGRKKSETGFAYARKIKRIAQAHF